MAARERRPGRRLLLLPAVVGLLVIFCVQAGLDHMRCVPDVTAAAQRVTHAPPEMAIVMCAAGMVWCGIRTGRGARLRARRTGLAPAHL